MNFFKIFGAALLACIISGLIGFIFWLIVIIGAVGSMSVAVTDVTPNSVLKISLDEIFTEAPLEDPFSQIDLTTLEVRPTLTLFNTLTAIEAAMHDPNIEGIYLSPSASSTVGAAALEEIRAALEDFKACGKPIIAYNDVYSQGGYYLASVADAVYAQPEGMIMWQGMASSTMFYKDLLDRLDISVEVFRPTACRYKSAVEPFIANKMSPENRSQMQRLYDSMWETLAQDVATSRTLTLEEVNRVADNLGGMDVDDALQAKMIDGLIYEDELPAIFREAGVDIDDNDMNYVDFTSYVSSTALNVQNIGSSRVAIIYAEGSIYDGEGIDHNIYGDMLAARVRRARLDDKIKAVVLRVNSPGGSALAADIIWREVALLQQQKPVVVSMGSYAASGGYYISAPADAIVADRLTLTGSIGVFGMKPNLERALGSKLGVHIDGVKTNSSASFMTSLGEMSPFERRQMIKSVDKVYDHFTTIVSQGRNLPMEDVLKVAQGRVWSGSEAVELGLVDAEGGLRKALAVAVDMAGIEDDFRIVELTDDATGLAAIFSGLQAKARAVVESQKAPFVDELQEIKKALSPIDTQHGLIMYSPYRIEL